MQKHVALRLAALAAGALSVVPAFAVAIVDYSTAATTASTELSSAVTTSLPLFGTIVAIGVGMRIVKKFWHG